MKQSKIDKNNSEDRTITLIDTTEFSGKPEEDQVVIQPEWQSDRSFSFRSLSWKILLIALIAAVAFATYLSFNLSQSNSQAELLEDIRDTQYPLQASLQESLFTLRFIQAKMQDAVLTGDSESLDEVDELRSQFESSINAVLEIDAEKKQPIEEIKAAFAVYYAASYDLATDLIGGGGDFATGVRRGEENAKLYSEVVYKLEGLKATELKAFTDAVNLATDRANAIIQIGFTVGLVTVALLLTLAFLISRWIILRINTIVRTLRNIARDEGDMSVRIPVEGKDEMAELSFWFNRFIAKLERMTNESTREIRRLAYTDSLTSLPNRRLFNAHLQAEVARCGHNQTALAVMFLDLDNFKMVNDQLGHDAGDELICEVARRLEHTVRGFDLSGEDFETGVRAGEDLVARMGGDEFMLVVSDIDDANTAAIIAERVRNAILAPIELLGTGIKIGVSIGISVFPDNGVSAEELTVKADLAMYEAKNSGKNMFRFFSSELEEAARQDAEIETALRHAVEHGDLEMYYQPKYDIKTGKIVGAEALARWQHATLGWVSPARFVPLAENSDLILELDEWVLRNVCMQIRNWREAGNDVVPIAINVSAKQAAHSELFEKVEAILEEFDLPPYSIEIEITETSALADMFTVADNIRRLKALSVTVALDDFGAGHSSLSLLKYCKVDTLKIDRGFVSELNQSGTRTTIISGVIAMAQVLKLTVIAEGVEEKEQLAELREMGCNYAQGYLFAKPMPADQFEVFMQEQVRTFWVSNV